MKKTKYQAGEPGEQRVGGVHITTKQQAGSPGVRSGLRRSSLLRRGSLG